MELHDPTNIDPLPIRQGGLFRCCIETWRTDAPPASLTQEGDLLDCAHCRIGYMIVRDGAWEWDNPNP